MEPAGAAAGGVGVKEVSVCVCVCVNSTGDVAKHLTDGSKWRERERRRGMSQTDGDEIEADIYMFHFQCCISVNMSIHIIALLMKAHECGLLHFGVLKSWRCRRSSHVSSPNVWFIIPRFVSLFPLLKSRVADAKVARTDSGPQPGTQRRELPHGSQRERLKSGKADLERGLEVAQRGEVCPREGDSATLALSVGH